MTKCATKWGFFSANLSASSSALSSLFFSIRPTSSSRFVFAIICHWRHMLNATWSENDVSDMFSNSEMFSDMISCLTEYRRLFAANVSSHVLSRLCILEWITCERETTGVIGQVKNHICVVRWYVVFTSARKPLKAVSIRTSRDLFKAVCPVRDRSACARWFPCTTEARLVAASWTSMAALSFWPVIVWSMWSNVSCEFIHV